MGKWSYGALLPIGLTVPVLAGALALLNGFDGLYGQDAFAYYDYATVSLKTQPFPPPFFYWPPGYPLAVLLMTLIVGVDPLAGQLVSLLGGGTTVVFTGLLAREVWRANADTGWLVPLVAGLVVASVGQLWQSSVVVMADTLALAAATIGIWSLAHYANQVNGNSSSTQARWLVLASGAMAHAAITRWIYGLVDVIGAIYALGLLYRTSQVSRSRALAHALVAVVVGVVALSPALVPMMIAQGGQVTYGGNFQNQLMRWDLLNAFRREVVNPDGSFSFPSPNGVYYGLMPGHAHYFTPLLALFAIPGLWIMFRRRMFAGGLLVVGWIGIVYVFLVGNPWQNVRFGLSYVPPVAVLIAIGVTELWRWVSVLWGRAVLVIIVCMGLVWSAVGGVSWTQRFIQRQQADLATARWVETQVPSDARVIAFGLTLTLQYYTNLETYELYTLVPEDLARLTNDDIPTYLLLDLINVESQWVGLSPANNYHWLRNGPGLMHIGRHRAFWLFRVGDA